jgi:two-component system, sensor histidine kinase
MTKRILVVEDEGITRKDIVERLANLGYEVAAAVGSAEEALQKAEKTKPDLALMDIILKGEMDGISCAGEMRSRFDLPVVYLTALADEQTLERAKLTGPFGYLLKPFDDRDLQPAIEIALYKHGMERRLRETQQQLFQSEKMASVGNLASGIAHEIRNPLGIILAGVECIGQMNVDEPFFRAAIGKIKESVLRANKIIVDLLKFSRSSSNEFLPVDLRQVAAEALALLEPRAKTAGVRVEKQFAFEDCIVSADMSLMRQVFFNLIANALDACKAGCVVTVVIRRNGQADGNTVSAEIADTGEGMGPDILKKIFDPFFTTKEPGKGTGLGLSITHMIVERHGGSIEARSEQGKGSSFTIALPFLTGAATPEKAGV